eukprot:PhF_6_TR9677/c0_g1_i2/m.14892
MDLLGNYGEEPKTQMRQRHMTELNILRLRQNKRLRDEKGSRGPTETKNTGYYKARHNLFQLAKCVPEPTTKQHQELKRIIVEAEEEQHSSTGMEDDDEDEDDYGNAKPRRIEHAPKCRHNSSLIVLHQACDYIEFLQNLLVEMNDQGAHLQSMVRKEM